MTEPYEMRLNFRHGSRTFLIIVVFVRVLVIVILRGAILAVRFTFVVLLFVSSPREIGLRAFIAVNNGPFFVVAIRISSSSFSSSSSFVIVLPVFSLTTVNFHHYFATFFGVRI